MVTRRKVLVIEDNVDLAELLGVFIRSSGHEVLVADDGWHALFLLESFSPDLVFVDIGLPGMDGYEVASRIRQRVGAATCIVALSGYAPKRAEAQTFDTFLLKPVYPADLARVLQSLPVPPASDPG